MAGLISAESHLDPAASELDNQSMNIAIHPDLLDDPAIREADAEAVMDLLLGGLKT